MRCAQSAADRPSRVSPLVEISGQASVQVMLVEPLDLGLRRAPDGQRRQRVEREEIHAVGLVADGGRTTGQLAQEEQLVDVQDAGWVAVGGVVPVKQRGE